MLGGMCPSCMFGSALEEEAALVEALPAVGEDYELLEPIAEGGMGVVWRARQRRLGRIVALKVLRERALPGEGAARRFRIEAAAAALLRHRHIVTVYEVGEVEGRYFLSMELLEGGSLSERLRKGALPLRAAVELLGKVARAIQHAHERGVLHRDIKPGNILLDAAGEPHVADFGLARLAEGEDHVTVSGAILGTPAYMSPEQASGGVQGEVTTASDVYSLGVVFYELLTGVLPFRAESQIALLLRVVEAEPARPGSVLPGLDRDLETICLKCLEKKPAARYPTAAALADDLDRWLLGEPIAARAVGTGERLWKWARRHKAQAALYTTALLALLAITAISLVFNRQLSRENERTREAERTTRHRLAAQHSIAAERLTNDGDWLRALPHIVENLTLTEGDPAAQRLGRLRFECAVRFSPRLEHLWLPEGAIGGLDYDERAGRIAIFAGSTAQVFDAATGAPFGPPLQHPAPIRDGYLACHSTRIVCQLLTGGWQLWNITQPGSPIASGMGNIFAMDTASGSQKRDGADGGTLATWHDDDKNDTVQLIDTRTGQMLGEPFHFTIRIDWAFASEETERLLVVTKDNLLHLLHLHTHQPILPPLAVGKEIILRAFTNDCRTAAFEAKASKGLHIFLLDLPTGKILAETPIATPSTVHNKHGWLNDRWAMLARADDGFLLRDASTNAELFHPLHRAQGTQASFANQRDTFATAARDSSLRIWDSNGASLTPLLWLSGVTEHLRLSTTGEHPLGYEELR